ncbi:MAG: DUF5615 family PIN-like protein [Bryobacteraceae bacterium]|nr:DUF5615 family PIN-like protein [Bryobacteraceae bacterium]
MRIFRLKRRLRCATRGSTQKTVWDEDLAGADDTTIAVRARSEGRILVTLDLDFANIRAYPPEEQSGLIVLRLRQQNKANALAVIKLWIVEEDRIRFRQGRG